MGSNLYEFSYIWDRVVDCLNRLFWYLKKSFPYFVDMMLFTISFVVVIMAFGVPKVPSKSGKISAHCQFPSMCFCFIWSDISYNPTVCKIFVANGTSLLGMNVRMFVPFFCSISLSQSAKIICQWYKPYVLVRTFH